MVAYFGSHVRSHERQRQVLWHVKTTDGQKSCGWQGAEDYRQRNTMEDMKFIKEACMKLRKTEK